MAGLAQSALEVKAANRFLDRQLSFKSEKMKAGVFNIKIGSGQNQVTLTILPKHDHFKVIYFGGVMGAVRCVDAEWILIDPEETEIGDLPEYTPDLIGDRLAVILNESTVEAIGKEIELYFQKEEQA